ncbi:MAG: TIGR00282 family metallophosphoesterase [Holosporaceae bacterium]|nr:TIGR00282 family metallophosphoesterase [Holosporaceae bacterium]
MRILILGDVSGRSGREAVLNRLPDFKKKQSVDFVVIDVDNAAHGFGITPDMARQFFEVGADVLTGGNHLFDQKDALALLQKEKRLLRPANMPDCVSGSGVLETTTADGRKIVAVHLIGRAGISFLSDNPFVCADKILAKYQIGKNVDAIVVDFHAEMTSEKVALGYYLDGRVSAVVGTHTHIPTADERILTGGTAFQTDVGMCGNYDSIIGVSKTLIERFVKGYSYQKLSPAMGEATFCGLLVDTDDKTGLAASVKAIRIGGFLSESF